VFVSIKYAGDIQQAINPKEKPREFPQVFMTDVDMREFSETGTMRYQLNTPLVRHYQSAEKAGPDDHTLLDKPNLIFLGDQTKPAWTINALQGRSDLAHHLFTLTNEVLAHQTSPSQGEITISTEELRINTHDQFAETDKAVTMRAARGQMETQGMRVDIKNDRIELLSNVKGTYEP
ncbi:MAG: LPS export ABC transporter periplasmic protein LptC, partial [Moraxellaceae bacterium]